MARLTRRQARRLALQARARRRTAQRKIQAKRIAARRRNRVLAQQRRRSRRIPSSSVTARTQTGTVFRASPGSNIVRRVPVFKEITTVSPARTVTTIKTKRQLRVEALNRRFLARRKGRALAFARRKAARRARALRIIAARGRRRR